jgi:hypothetical protein
LVILMALFFFPTALHGYKRQVPGFGWDELHPRTRAALEAGKAAAAAAVRDAVAQDEAEREAIALREAEHAEAMAALARGERPNASQAGRGNGEGNEDGVDANVLRMAARRVFNAAKAGARVIAETTRETAESARAMVVNTTGLLSRSAVRGWSPSKKKEKEKKQSSGATSSVLGGGDGGGGDHQVSALGRGRITYRALPLASRNQHRDGEEADEHDSKHDGNDSEDSDNNTGASSGTESDHVRQRHHHLPRRLRDVAKAAEEAAVASFAAPALDAPFIACAHRGGMNERPENTMSAFQRRDARPAHAADVRH